MIERLSQAAVMRYFKELSRYFPGIIVIKGNKINKNGCC
jgi:hypothetical protein